MSNDIAYAYFDSLDFVITDSIQPQLRRHLEKVQAGHRRAIRCSQRGRNIRRASHHLQKAVRLFLKHRHRIELLPAEAFANKQIEFHEPNYEP